jgi:hypothetical protein
MSVPFIKPLKFGSGFKIWEREMLSRESSINLLGLTVAEVKVPFLSRGPTGILETIEAPLATEAAALISPNGFNG